MMINVWETPAGAGGQPRVTLDPEKIYAVMINEVAPADLDDDFYGPADKSEYGAAAVALFREAGLALTAVDEITALGVYMTNAVKTPKTGYEVGKDAIEQGTRRLKAEIGLFPNLKVIMLMGDVAKKAFNMIAKRATGKNAVPAVSTYKLRDSALFYESIQILPSYIMTGRNLQIEKQKLAMAAGDVKKMLDIIGARQRTI